MTFRHSNIFDALRRMFDPPAEPIVVCAACADGSGAITPSWAAEMRALRPSLVVIRVATCSDAIFETNCDTFGPAREVASYLLEMRSDLLLQEPGFDSVLIGALRAEPDLLAVSARGIYGWRKVVAPEGGPIDRFVGRLRARAGRHATLRLPCRIRHARTDGAQRVRRQPFRRGQRRP